MREKITKAGIKAFLKGNFAFFKDVYKSAKIVLTVERTASGKRNWASLPRSDLLIVRRVQLTFRHCGHLAAFQTIPFVGYLALTALFFPRHLLTRYFWTDEQKVEYAHLDYEERRSFYRQLHRNLLAMPSVQSDVNSKTVIEKVSSGNRIERTKLQDVLLRNVKLEEMQKSDLYILARCWQVWRVFPEKRLCAPKSMILWQLRRRVKIAQEDDEALLREFSTLTPEDVKEACQFRGLRTQSVDNETLSTCLRDFCHLSHSSQSIAVTALAGPLFDLRLHNLKPGTYQTLDD